MSKYFAVAFALAVPFGFAQTRSQNTVPGTTHYRLTVWWIEEAPQRNVTSLRGMNWFGRSGRLAKRESVADRRSRLSHATPKRENKRGNNNKAVCVSS
jgi:hypothetical protein